MALFDFILTTHEGPRRRRDGLVFVPYLADSYKQDKGRLIWASREEVVPEVFGGWPPTLQNIADNDLYKASMLLLFNPWRNLEDLKSGHNSFAEVFGAFESMMSDEVRDQIESYYECEWSSLLADAEGYSLFNGS
ncbi:hypothetical protein PILCRDRAFT_17039 [Piloderma croceum F 1598]|uniref:Uncharacterized protein n=1 Tax=Piloderma croceum (strain F 1598) TaxID=765440 RepID=A0A0C3EUH1_PILCF|nr:hypothetical protein PILCRDRAFT_17039 [Piloderma croceum F 1598]